MKCGSSDAATAKTKMIYLMNIYRVIKTCYCLYRYFMRFKEQQQLPKEPQALH